MLDLLSTIVTFAAETAHAEEESSHTAFYVLGGLAATWAVVLAAIGLTQPDFPKTLGAQRATMLISTLVVAGAIGSAIVTA